MYEFGCIFHIIQVWLSYLILSLHYYNIQQMKITQFKQMTYNSFGDIQEMKFFKSTKRVANHQNDKPLQIMCQQTFDPPFKQKQQIRFSASKSNRSSKMSISPSISASNFTSSPTIVHYDFYEQKKTNWKFWILFIIIIAGSYFLLESLSKKPIISSKDNSEIQKSDQIQSENKSEDGAVYKDALRLVSMFYELLKKQGDSLSFNSFKKKMSQQGILLSRVTWELFEQLLATQNSIKIDHKKNNTFGGLKDQF